MAFMVPGLPYLRPVFRVHLKWVAVEIGRGTGAWH
jgi:hypothetical protein